MNKLVYSGNKKYRYFSKFDKQSDFDYCILKDKNNHIYVNNDNLLNFSHSLNYLPAVLVKNKNYWFNTHYLNRPLYKTIKRNLYQVISFEEIKELKYPFYHILFCKIKIIEKDVVYVEDENKIMEKYDSYDYILSKFEINNCYCVVVDSTNKILVDIFYDINEKKLNNKFLDIFKLT